MSYNITEIEGIGVVFAEKLANTGIVTTDDLLRECASPAGRKNVTGATGISETLVLKWTNMADLMRISGVGPQFSELLNGAGVDTVKELRTRNTANLAAKMEEVNSVKSLTRAVPPAATVEKWITAAKTMDPILTY